MQQLTALQSLTNYGDELALLITPERWIGTGALEVVQMDDSGGMRRLMTKDWLL